MTEASLPSGLCATCSHARIVESKRGSRFLLCEKASSDDRFLRYPRLPVIECPGFAEVEVS